MSSFSNNRPIRVVAVMEAYTVTGPAKNLIRFCRRMQQDPAGSSPVEISIATFYRGKAQTASNQFIEAVRSAGVPIDIVTERFRLDPRVGGQLSLVLKERKPDIVQTHGVKAHFLVWACRLNHGRRWIAYHHGYTREDLKMRLYNQLNRFTLPAADRVIAVCRPFAEALEHTGVHRSRIEVLPNSIEAPTPVACDEVDRLRKQLGVQRDERIVLTVGRFSSEKAHVDLVPATAALMRLLPNQRFRIVLVGDGPERRAVEKAAADTGLGEFFVFTGHQLNVNPYFKLADVFALPSHSEGSPNVVLEAMAHNVPIVATWVGGVPEAVQSGKSALLVPPRVPEQFAECIARILTQPELAGKLIKNAAVDLVRYSPEEYSKSLISIYRHVCAVENDGRW